MLFYVINWILIISLFPLSIFMLEETFEKDFSNVKKIFMILFGCISQVLVIILLLYQLNVGVLNI